MMPKTWRKLVLETTCLSSLLLAAGPVVGQVLPQGGGFTAGGGSIVTSGSTMTVTQQGGRGIVAWNSFSIGQGGTVSFENGSGATLNRVTGGDASSIMGRLTATGSLYLINPNGVVVGPTGVVTTGGSFAASTHDVTNDDFLAGRALTFKGDSTATVENLGAISSSGGDVLLVAREVSNQGTISAPNGTAALAGGHEVLLTESNDSSNGRVLVRVGPGKVDNQGTIQAAQAELKAAGGNIYALAGNNGGIVRATGSATRAGEVWLSADDGHVQNTGSIAATNVDGSGGKVTVAAGNGRMVVNTGTLSASGTRGGTVKVAARTVSNQGKIKVDGSAGAGGAVDVAFGRSYIATSGSEVSARGVTQGGSIALASGEADSSLFTSGAHQADASAGNGGSIDLFASTINLVDAVLNASGASQGGSIRIGGDYQGSGDMLKAGSVLVSGTATLRADGSGNGAAGGRIVVWSEDNTDFYGHASARGTGGGAGGLIEVSSHDTVVFAGMGDAGSDTGTAGALLLDPKNIVISSVNGILPQYQLIDPNADTASGYGTAIASLSNGNVVVTNPTASVGGLSAGAVYLFNGLTGALISMVTGADSGDAVGGGGVTVLSNGNYVIKSPSWANGGLTSAGAATWGSGSAGVAGIVSAANSLVGSSAGDRIGSAVTALTNGNYVTYSPSWANGLATSAGAATWGSGSAGVAGIVTTTNSLVGATAGDGTGLMVTALLTNGNYVVSSTSWDNGGASDAGIVTWGDGTVGVTGANDTNNTADPSSPINKSFYGMVTNGRVGSSIVALDNGHYLILSPDYNNARGVVTWGNGTASTWTGDQPFTAGPFANSLGGSTDGDRIGSAVTILSNGNFVVSSTSWTNGAATNAGAVTWGSAATGTVVGTVSSSNSLVGVNADDKVGTTVTALTNGNYVVGSPGWKDGGMGHQNGAATWGDGTAGIVGGISITNSLVGLTHFSRVGSVIVALSNGNYVVGSPDWNDTVSKVGAVTWGNGGTGVAGYVSSANSLVGGTTQDQIGSQIIALSNGNYVTASSYWSNGVAANAGAVTWGNGTSGTTGVVSASNSLVGTGANNRVGYTLTALVGNGNYVVGSPFWTDGAVSGVGAVTWGNGTVGVTGAVSASNSLVGTSSYDGVGGEIKALANGDYTALTALWDNGLLMDAGAMTWGNGTAGTTGAVSASNSLVGSAMMAGLGATVVPLSNGGYIYAASLYSSSPTSMMVGAAAWSSNGKALTGLISPLNSFIGWGGGQILSAVGIGGLTQYAAGSDGTLVLAHNGASAAVAGRVYIGLPLNLLTYARAQDQTITIHPDAVAAILNTGTALNLQANNDITVDSDITVDNPAGDGGAFSLWAGRSILLNANIVTDNGAFTALANAKGSTGVVNAHRDSGAAAITMAAGKTINAGTGAVTLTLDSGAGNTNTASGDITLDGVTAGAITVENAGPDGGDIVINSGASLTASGIGNALVLAASSGGNFINNGTSSALSAANGRWLVYAKNAAGNTLGGLTGTAQYSATYAGAPPGSVAGSANTLLYSDADPNPPPPTTPTTPTTPSGAVLTLSPFDVTITYGDAVPSFTYGASGLQGTDTLASVLTGSPLFSTNAAVGSGVGRYTISLDLSGLSVAPGYTLGSTTATLTIVARVLTLSGGKIYDGTTAVSGLTLAGLAPGDDVSLGGVGVLSDRNAGSGKTITGLSLTGGAASNYVLSGASAYTVAARTVTLTGGKTYDGTTAVSGLGLSGLLAGDDVSLDGSGSLSDGNAGSGKTVSGLSLVGAAAGNYVIGGSSSYTVTARTLTASGSRTYDGTTAVSELALSGLVSGDDVSLSGVGALGSKGAESGKTVNGVSLVGRDAGNYTLGGTSYTVAGKALTWSVPDASSAFGAAGSWTVALNGLANGDQVEAILSAFDASGKLVPPSALGIGFYTLRVTGLTGRDAGNYVLASSGNTAGRLTVAPSGTGGTSVAALLNTLPVVTTPMTSSGGALLGASGGVAGPGSASGGTGAALGDRTAGAGVNAPPAGGWVGAASVGAGLASDAPVVVDAGLGTAPSIGSAVENSLSTGGFMVVFRQPAGFSANAGGLGAAGAANTGDGAALAGAAGDGTLAFASSFTTFRADEAVQSTVVGSGGTGGTQEDSESSGRTAR